MDSLMAVLANINAAANRHLAKALDEMGIQNDFFMAGIRG